MFRLKPNIIYHILLSLTIALLTAANLYGAETAETDSFSRVAVVYKVNKADMLPDSILASVVDQVNTIMADSLSTTSYVKIAGSSSPEGPARRNEYLAQRRANVLRDYLLQNTSLRDSIIRLEYYPEDWESVMQTLNRGNYPYTEKVLNVLQRYPDRQSRKIAVKGIDHGSVWRQLLRDVFPYSRNARLSIVSQHRREVGKPSLLSADGLLTPPLSVRRPEMETTTTPPYTDRFIAVKNNLLFDALLVANLGIEVELWQRWSIDIPVWYSPYNITPTRKLRLLASQPELRYWFGKAGKGHFVGLNTSIVGFNIAINDHGRYQDPDHAALGMGLSYGYATYLDRNRRWGLEFNIGVGSLHYHYDTYYNYHNGHKFDSGSSTYYGITRAGITISYQWHRQRKNRAIFRW